MTRGRIIAAVILALVLAVLMAFGPVRVWDWMTLRTVEEYWPSGQIKKRYAVRWWDSSEGPEDSALLFRAMLVADYDAWHENGETLSAFARRWSLKTKRIARWAAQLEEERRSVRFHPLRVVECVEPVMEAPSAVDIERILAEVVCERWTVGACESRLRCFRDGTLAPGR